MTAEITFWAVFFAGFLFGFCSVFLLVSEYGKRKYHQGVLEGYQRAGTDGSRVVTQYYSGVK